MKKIFAIFAAVLFCTGVFALSRYENQEIEMDYMFFEDEYEEISFERHNECFYGTEEDYEMIISEEQNFFGESELVQHHAPRFAGY